MHIAVIPRTQWLEEFLVERDMVLDPKEPKVLHYFGTSERVLKGLIKKLKPDFVITHSRDFFNIKNVSLAYLWLSERKDIFSSPTIFTTSVSLTQEYFRRLSLQKRIVEIFRTSENRTAQSGRSKRLKAFWKKFKDLMFWH